MRPKGMPPGIRPANVADGALPVSENNALSQLVAISMTPAGVPERMFTTNRWVTGETWYEAHDVIAMLDGFVVDLDRPSPLLNRWLTAMLIPFRPHIEDLLLERDRVVAQWQVQHPGNNVFEDRRPEITSSIATSVQEQIEWLDQTIEGSPTRTESKPALTLSRETNAGGNRNGAHHG
jgi:hypothetical protein